MRPDSVSAGESTFACGLRPGARGSTTAARRAEPLDSSVARGFRGARERHLEAVGDEVERRPTGHLDRIVLEVREDEHRCVVGRLLAPLAAPIVLPGAAN